MVHTNIGVQIRGRYQQSSGIFLEGFGRLSEGAQQIEEGAQQMQNAENEADNVFYLRHAVSHSLCILYFLFSEKGPQPPRGPGGASVQSSPFNKSS